MLDWANLESEARLLFGSRAFLMAFLHGNTNYDISNPQPYLIVRFTFQLSCKWSVGILTNATNQKWVDPQSGSTQKFGNAQATYF
jgi:hypothetical protein